MHPWQWANRLAVTFAGDVATGRLVCLGHADDEYLAQQSIRTFFNVSDPSRHYVKTALSVVNMGFVRGLSAAYMEGTPAINDWLAGPDREGRRSWTCRSCASARRSATAPRCTRRLRSQRSPYPKMLAALWRESPAPRCRQGERLATMASLLHTDERRALAGRRADRRSGLDAGEWLRRYLDAYLRPLLHCYREYDLVFMPHGENLILVLEDDVPVRVLMKDIAEEIVLMDPDRELPPDVERIRAEVPDELKPLSIFTDVFDCFFRFLSAILVREGDAGRGRVLGRRGGVRGRARPRATTVRRAVPAVVPEPAAAARHQADGGPAGPGRLAAAGGRAGEPDRPRAPPRFGHSSPRPMPEPLEIQAMEHLPNPLWRQILERPERAPELIALAAAKRFSDPAAEWVRENQRLAQHPHKLARKAYRQARAHVARRGPGAGPGRHGHQRRSPDSPDIVRIDRPAE